MNLGPDAPGVPRISPALLAKRLRMLKRAGLVEDRREGNRVAYLPTAACEELRPVVEALGSWGLRWMPELGDEDLYPHLLLWDMHRHITLDSVPKKRTVVQFNFTDIRPSVQHWWLVIQPNEVDVCDYDPGFDVDLLVESDLRTLTHVWRGDCSWDDKVREGDLPPSTRPRIAAMAGATRVSRPALSMSTERCQYSHRALVRRESKDQMNNGLWVAA